MQQYLIYIFMVMIVIMDMVIKEILKTHFITRSRTIMWKKREKNVLQTTPYKPILWGWVRLKVHFLTWYQSHCLKHILVRFMFVGRIISSAIGPLPDHPLMSSPTHEMYIPRREGDVLELPDRLEINQFHSI